MKPTQKGAKRMGMKEEKEQVTIRIPAQLKERLEKEAYELNYSLNEYISLIIHHRK